jgi:Response regulator containing a CheY-like receiver domain and an HTH DNA-binding domain
MERQGPERRQAVLRAAGSWYAGNGDYIQAMDCFYQADDFDQLLLAFAMDNGHSINSEHKETIIRYFSDCPEETKSKHPVAYLIYARKLFMVDERERYAKECQKAGEYIEAVHDGKTKNHLLGELELTKSFTKYNDLRGMVEHQAKAYALLDGPSKLFDHKNFFTFGASSVLYMFYRQSGMAEQAVKYLTDYMPRYCLITSGHGAGAEYVMQAEWHFHRGDYENAGIIIHKAIKPARSNRQIAILLCALFLQIRLAFVGGDLPAAGKLLRQMRAEVEEYGQYQVVHTVDMCEGFIHAHLSQERKIPAWIADGNLQESRLYFPGHAFFNIVYGKVLLISGQYLKLLGLTGQFLDVAGIFPNLLGQVYTHIYAAAAYHRLKRHQEAREALRQAAAIAAPDQFVMPFVENGDELGPILDELKKDENYAEFVVRVKAAYAAFAPKLAAMRAAGQPGDAVDSLTPREREVAGLVADGLSNQAIAKKLIVEETTVKKTLQNIYAKLGIGGRTMLARLIIEQK